MKHILVVGFAFLVTGCDTEAKNAVKDQLIDPESAQFYDVASQESVTCGFVNGRNRMGGFAGRQAFIYEDGIAELYNDPDAAFITKFGTKCPSAAVTKFLQQIVSK